ncbi:MAG: ABC transporter ATP-binding protein [Lachnospiraceae bacterium]
MRLLHIEGVSFSYPESNTQALREIELEIHMGEFMLLCGNSGCGKTTLLRLLKPQIAPVGHLEGKIERMKVHEIGFVFQNPEQQIVTDTVRHELAFGLENMGLPTNVIRQRVAETALFFGIDTWIDQSIHQISGGEKQLVNLAAIIAMRPKLLLLDEPTAQLDPVARKNFLELLVRVNRELGIAVLLSEHQLGELLPLSDRVIFMSHGSILFQGPPQTFISYVYAKQFDFREALPAATRIASILGHAKEIWPLTVREGRGFLQEHFSCAMPIGEQTSTRFTTISTKRSSIEYVLLVEHLWFRYEKQLPFVLKGVNLMIYKHKVHMILGGNGSGKTTLLGVLAKRYYANRGKIKLGSDKQMPKIGLLTQNPKAMFSTDTVEAELKMAQCDISLVQQLHLEHLKERHPYDLSGGEQQRLALAIVLATKPELLLLDEPTKGLDPFLKEELGHYIETYATQGGTIICVTHDVEFAAKYGQICSLLFEGEILATEETRSFFAGNTFYTTDAARILYGMIKEGLYCEDVTQIK